MNTDDGFVADGRELHELDGVDSSDDARKERLRRELDRLRDQVESLRQQHEALSRQSGTAYADSSDHFPDKRREQDEPSTREPSHRRRLTIVAVLCGLIIAVIAAGYGWRYLESYESTDDAQIDGHLDPISSRIDGSVVHVWVENTQYVKQREPLVDIDPRDYEVAVESARATLSQALAALQSARQDYVVAKANAMQAEATNLKAQRDVGRYELLMRYNVVAREQYEEELRIGKVAAVLSARASAESAGKLIGQRQAAVGVAQAAWDQANLNLSYTRIVAPADGVVNEKTVQVGQRVQPGQQLLTVTPLDDIWVTSNFKETQLRRMRRGQRATIHVDALGRDYAGYVEGLAGASGEMASVLPPENATGNYVKVVQRFPVRLRFDPGQDNDHRLRLGMSVEPKVWLQ